MALFGLFGKKKKAEEVKQAPVATPAKKEEKKEEIKAEAPKAEAPKVEPKKEEAKAAPVEKKTSEAAPKAAPKTAPKAAPKTAAKPKTEEKPKAEEKPAEESAPKKSGAVGKFEIKKSKDDRYVFNLYAANMVIVATSQVYSSSTSAMNGIKSVIENAEKAPVEDQTLKSYETLTYPKWEIYQDKGGQYRFRLNASNGSCICHSQGYTTKASCKNGIESIKKTAKAAVVDKSYLKKD